MPTQVRGSAVRSTFVVTGATLPLRLWSVGVAASRGTESKALHTIALRIGSATGCPGEATLCGRRCRPPRQRTCRLLGALNQPGRPEGRPDTDESRTEEPLDHVEMAKGPLDRRSLVRWTRVRALLSPSVRRSARIQLVQLLHVRDPAGLRCESVLPSDERCDLCIRRHSALDFRCVP